MWRLSTGTPIYTDFVFLGMNVVVPALLLYISNKYWRLGLLFIIAYGVAKESSVLVYQRSLIAAILLNILSILFLIPALLYFLKLRGEKETSMKVKDGETERTASLCRNKKERP
jgi:hypothetical protein